MNNLNEIKFIEGSVWTVSMDIPDFTPLSNYQASIQFRNLTGVEIMNFQTSDNSLSISGQTIVFTILPILSIGQYGKGKWQLAIWTDTTDVVKFQSYDYTITKADNR